MAITLELQLKILVWVFVLIIPWIIQIAWTLTTIREESLYDDTVRSDWDTTKFFKSKKRVLKYLFIPYWPLFDIAIPSLIKSIKEHYKSYRNLPE